MMFLCSLTEHQHMSWARWSSRHSEEHKAGKCLIHELSSDATSVNHNVNGDCKITFYKEQ